MRKNYFAKKFVAYSMAFAVAFSTLTVSPVFVREAKAAATCVGNIAASKGPKVAAITDLKTKLTSGTVYDGAVFLSTVNTDDAAYGTNLTVKDFLESVNLGFQNDAQTVSNVKSLTLEPVTGKIQNTAEKNYEMVFVTGDYGQVGNTDDSKEVIGYPVDPVVSTNAASKKDTIKIKNDGTILESEGTALKSDNANGGIWFKLVPNEGTFKYSELEGTPATLKEDTITFTYFTLVKKADVAKNTNVTLEINKEVDDDYGIYMYVDKGATTEDGTAAKPTTLSGIANVKTIINVCKQSNYTAKANKENVYAAKGAKANLSVDVTPTTANTTPSKVEYTWSKAGKTLDCKDATLSIAEVKDADCGIYKCVVTDGMKTTNISITLKELTADVVATREKEITTVKKVLANGTHFNGDDKYKLPNAKVTLTTSLPSGDYHYIWAKNTNAKVALTTSNAISYDSTKTSITVEDSRDDTAKGDFVYTCYAIPTSIYNADAGIQAALKKLKDAKNDADKYEVIYNDTDGLMKEERDLVGTATNIVNQETFRFEPASEPTVLESETVLVKLGDDLKLTAPTYTDATNYAWTINGRNYTGATLNINTLDQQDLGTITCTVTKSTAPNTVTKKFNVLCNSDVKATAESVTSKAGQKNVDLKVNATSTLPVKYTWYKQVYNPAVGHKVFEDVTNPTTPEALANTNEDQSKFTIGTVDGTPATGDFYTGEIANSHQYLCVVTDGINTVQVPVRIGQIDTYKVYENQAKLDAGRDITKEAFGYTVDVADYNGNKVTLAPIVVAASEDIEKQLTYQWTKDGVNCSTDKALEVECTDTATTYALTVSEGTNTTTITYVVTSLKDEDLKAVSLITAGNVDPDVIDIDVERNVIYTGKEINPVNKVTVVTGKGTYTLKAGTDYDVELTDAVNAGVSLYSVVLKGLLADQYDKFTNDQKEQLSGVFTITRADNKVEIADNTVVVDKSVLPKTVTNLGKGALTYTYYADADATTEIAAPTKVGTYYVKATAAATMNYNEAESNVAKVVIAPSTTKVTKVATNANAVKLTWSKVTGATAYRVYIKKSGKWTKVADTKSLTYTVKKLASATKYEFAVKAFAGSIASPKYVTKTAYTTPAKVATPAVKAKGRGKVAVSYGKVTRATGYQVYMAKGNGSYKKVAQGKLTAITKSKLTKGATYKFKVRAYKKVGSNVYYGAFSSAKAVKVK